MNGVLSETGPLARGQALELVLHGGARVDTRGTVTRHRLTESELLSASVTAWRAWIPVPDFPVDWIAFVRRDAHPDLRALWSETVGTATRINLLEMT